jgi:hypothetical protein
MCDACSSSWMPPSFFHVSEGQKVRRGTKKIMFLPPGLILNPIPIPRHSARWREGGTYWGERSKLRSTRLAAPLTVHSTPTTSSRCTVGFEEQDERKHGKHSEQDGARPCAATVAHAPVDAPMHPTPRR